jgi:hypothetical protein
MAIQNNKSIKLDELKIDMKKEFKDYSFEIHKNALTIGSSKNTKLNVVEVGEEFWIVEAVPFPFKIAVVLSFMGLIAYLVQLQGWHWGINLVLYFAALIILGYVANWLYRLVYYKNYKEFKPAIIKALKKRVE